MESIGPLPMSATLLRHETVRHGFDCVYLFEFSCADTVLRDTLVRKWNLRDFTGSEVRAVSFASNDYPSWWPTDMSRATHVFGRCDEENEVYWSMWERADVGRLYVEVGGW